MSPSTAFKIGEKFSDPLDVYLNDVYTVPVNLAGVPAVVVPAGVGAAGLPIGVQLIGAHFDEATLLRAGDALMKIG